MARNLTDEPEMTPRAAALAVEKLLKDAGYRMTGVQFTEILTGGEGRHDYSPDSLPSGVIAGPAMDDEFHRFARVGKMGPEILKYDETIQAIADRLRDMKRRGLD